MSRTSRSPATREHSVAGRLGAGVSPSATELTDGARVTRQTIVKHLQVPEGAGLVTHERRGREVLCALEARRLDEARAFLGGVSAGRDRGVAGAEGLRSLEIRRWRVA